MMYFTEVTEEVYESLLEEGIPTPSRYYHCSFEDEPEDHIHLEWDSMSVETRDYICSLLDKINLNIATRDRNRYKQATS